MSTDHKLTNVATTDVPTSQRKSTTWKWKLHDVSDSSYHYTHLNGKKVSTGNEVWRG